MLKYILTILGTLAVLLGYYTNDYMVANNGSYIMSVWIPFLVTTIGIITLVGAWMMDKGAD